VNARHAKMVGVILAAGKGTRMYPFSETMPKPILPIGNRRLLDYQVDVMQQCGIDEVLVVIGHMGYAIVDAMGHGEQHEIMIRYVERKETLGMAHALGMLEQEIDSPFMLFLGDIYFVTDDLRPVMEEVLSGAVNANLISKIEKDPEMIKRNFAIFESAPGRVGRVIEKPRHVRNEIKGCGLYVFDQHIFDAIRRTPRTAMRDEYEITDSIQIMVNDGHVVCHRPVAKDDRNLTVPEDLLEINLLDLGQRGLDNLVGRDVQLPTGAVLENSVIGDGVVVEHPIRIRNSLIFPRVRVGATNDLENVILDGVSTVHCERRGRS